MDAPWQEISARIAAACAPAGFDLVQPLQVGWYNDAVAADYRLPDLGRPSALAVLIGNTRALWPPFIAALRAQRALLFDTDPIDRYTVEQLEPVLRQLEATEMRWAHDLPPRRIAIQRLAHVAGLAYLSPTNLSVHPVYGPWIALRAVAVFDTDGPPGPPPQLADPCRDCAQSCVPLLQRAVRATPNAGIVPGAIAATWPLWLAVRDACPVGRAHRYGDEQIDYHYRNDRSVLRRAVQRST